MKEDETRLLIRFLKRLHDGDIGYRGHPDLSLVAYRLQAPTAIAGKITPIALEIGLVERVIQINLNPDTLTASRPMSELSMSWPAGPWGDSPFLIFASAWGLTLMT